MSDSAAAIAQRWFEEVWNQGRDETIDELFGPDTVAHGLGESDAPIRGPEEFRPFYRNMRDTFPDCHITITDVVEDSHQAVVRFDFQGTHKGAGLGIPPTGRRIYVKGMTLVKVRDGKIVEGYNIWDQLGLLRQLGVFPKAEAVPAEAVPKDRFFGE
jgi:steroid delta-isomerase-like uncharacterized protein